MFALLALAACCLLFGSCAGRGEPVGGSCPVEGLTLPPGAVRNKLPDGLVPPKKDKHGTRTEYSERDDYFRYYALSFDCPGGIDAVHDYYKLEAKSVGLKETFETRNLETYRAGFRTCVGRRLLFVSEDLLTAVCLQRTKDFAEGEEHDIGEFLLTSIQLTEEETNARPSSGMTF